MRGAVTHPHPYPARNTGALINEGAAMSNAGDPLLKRADWRAAVAYWRASSEPCARCGGHIDRGSRTRGPDSLDVGHIVSRYEARRMGWTDAQINALTNTQPEHQTCGRKHGARLGNAIRWQANGPRPRPLTSESW